MKDSSLKTAYDTTPATLGDLDTWGGRLMEIIDEAKEELKAEFNQRMDAQDQRLDSHEQRLSNMQDTLAEHTLLLKSHTSLLKSHTSLLKSIDKKLSKL